MAAHCSEYQSASLSVCLCACLCSLVKGLDPPLGEEGGVGMVLLVLSLLQVSLAQLRLAVQLVK